jgi:nicotinamide mononucleotide adenylyltransferase
MDDIKQKLKTLTEQYKRILPDEYVSVVAAIAQNRKKLKDEWAQMKGSDMIQRHLLEMPEMLDNLITMNLTDEELKVWNQDKEHKLRRWYAKEYPEFRVSKSI